MEKKDLSISQDDLADIFGGMEIAPPPAPAAKKAAAPAAAPAAPAKPAEPAAMAKEEPAKSKLIMDRAEEAYRVQEEMAAKAAAAKAAAAKPPEQHVDDLIKRAQELEKEMTKSSDEPLKFADFIDEKVITGIIHAYNDLKSAFAKELAGRIDQKSIDNLLLRSLEKTAVNFMLLKNTSWDSTGELKVDGSIDTERFIKNLTLYKESIQEVDKEIEESLKALMSLRLSAVKKGLGADKYAEIKAGLLRRLAVIEGGYSKPVSGFIKKNVLENSLRKADEEK
jgi:hypothetical protein